MFCRIFAVAFSVYIRIFYVLAGNGTLNEENMKRITMFLVLVLMAFQTLSAKSVKSLMDEYRGENHAEYTYISPAMMLLAKAAVKQYSKDASEMLKNVTSVRVLRLNDCKTKVKKRFCKEIANLDEEEYQPLVMTASAKRSTDKDFKVLVKADAEAVSEFVVLSTSKDDCSLMQVEGKIALSDIQKIIDDTQVLENMKD